MELILFMNDEAIAIVEGTEKFRQSTLASQRIKYYEKNKGYGSWNSYKEFKDCCYWHYHSVERITSD